MSLEFRPFVAGDAVLLAMQPSQHFELGLEHRQYSMDEGHALAASGPAWTAYRGARIVGIAGFRECYTGHAVAWAALSEDVGSDHLACTRFARREIAAAPFRRIEALVEKDNPRALAWASLVGLEPVHELRGYGPEGKTHVLFERVKL